ncbi:formylglycine-generating enzyme family protein [Streptomyces sp. NA04227]|uniref:formylglycine-generating enzyme family protein n=1 Tax=Streptomyces sp. NA04227 TaxID=2742136 RepID=UPI0015900A73|nr:formylglycine-generating enzyme family protein [Streptomyces sp. NA04227]QKW08744.1 formylglycine-generating enzyme family protein [Streptomyces sp. NA04227]
MSAECCTPGQGHGHGPELLTLAAPGPKQPSSHSPSSARGAASAARVARQLLDLPGGRFLMGTEDPDGFPADREGPVREAEVAAFRIAPTTVTNAQYATFVKATGYVTEAERFGFSFVFGGFLAPEVAAVAAPVDQVPWWRAVGEASWRSPEGPGSAVAARQNHPVVHVSHNDALAYCAWSGTRLPTETEWEYAARGGLEQRRYPWGDELTPRGRHMCNIWQGEFPHHNTEEDGYAGTAPVKSFRPNGFGLYNAVGNVWEWCADWFTPDNSRVMRGGSYLCHDSYCNRYRVAARSSNTPDSSTGNIGFRVAADRRA